MAKDGLCPDCPLRRSITSLRDGIFIHRRARDELPRDGLVRINQIIAPYGRISVSKSTWWDRVKSGRYPKPTEKIPPGLTTWRARDIRRLFERSAH